MVRSRAQAVSEVFASAAHRWPTIEAVIGQGEAREFLAGGATPDAGPRLFQIGSVTKTFTALVLARAVVRGDLELDQPVRDLLPEFRGWPSGEPITLLELATHTSGLPRIPGTLWSEVLRRNPDPYARIDAAALGRAIETTRLRRRGKVSYSNLGFGLLGHALAVGAGTDYATLVGREVTGPLGMIDTVIDPTNTSVDVAAGHTRGGRRRPVAWRFDAMAGCGALWSTTTDLATYLSAHLHPPDAELGEAIRLTLRPHARLGRSEVGLAWHGLPPMARTPGWFHNGGTYGFRSHVAFVPDRNRFVVVLGNADRSVDGLAFTMLQDQAPPGSGAA